MCATPTMILCVQEIASTQSLLSVCSRLLMIIIHPLLLASQHRLQIGKCGHLQVNSKTIMCGMQTPAGSFAGWVGEEERVAAWP